MGSPKENDILEISNSLALNSEIVSSSLILKFSKLYVRCSDLVSPFISNLEKIPSFLSNLTVEICLNMFSSKAENGIHNFGVSNCNLLFIVCPLILWLWVGYSFITSHNRRTLKNLNKSQCLFIDHSRKSFHSYLLVAIVFYFHYSCFVFSFMFISNKIISRQIESHSMNQVIRYDTNWNY